MMTPTILSLVSNPELLQSDSSLFDVFASTLRVFEVFVLLYFLVLNSTYFSLIVMATIEFTRYFRRAPFAGSEDVFANPMTPGVSVIVPAHNEGVGIVDNVRAMLSLRFPLFEIIVVDDGSTDDTFDRLRDGFDLVEVPRYYHEAIPVIGAVTSIYVARQGDPIVVVRKENGHGSKADAVNAGLNAARMPLVCMVDADSLLDADALLRVVKPFVDDPDHVVATGGVIRPANGCTVERGSIVKTAMPKGWTARIQVIEYLRSFLLGRTGWSTLQSLFIISGAFGMFRRDLILELGGLDTTSMGEDADIVASLHHTLRAQGRKDYRIVFVSEPVCWTEVPSDPKVLARQRKRWSRGLAEVLWKHKAMFMNPKYGRIGMVVMPYYVFFELLGPIVELAGLAMFIVTVAAYFASSVFGIAPLAGLLNPEYAVLFAAVAIGYGFLLSVAAIAVEEFSYHRMSSWRDLGVSFLAAAFENIGYRQMHALWRLRGLVWWLRRGESAWGAMPRSGFVAGETFELPPLSPEALVPYVSANNHTA